MQATIAGMMGKTSDSSHSSDSGDTSDSSEPTSSACVAFVSGSADDGSPNHSPCHHFDHTPPDTECALQVQRWTAQIPISLGLCPWAGRSHSLGRLRYVTCDGESPADVINRIELETSLLEAETVPSLSSTLIVCPNVNEWSEFQSFEDFVGSGVFHAMKDERLLNVFTFVAFHPKFLRWRGLPNGLQVGSVIKSHWGMIGRKSVGETATATIIETENKAFGGRKVKVRFHQVLEGRRQEQYIPIEWIEHASSGAPLPDNAMHQAPFPSIHIIANRDLASLSIRKISRVKRRNAHKMMKLGWSGIQKLNQSAVG